MRQLIVQDTFSGWELIGHFVGEMCEIFEEFRYHQEVVERRLSENYYCLQTTQLIIEFDSL